MSRSRKRSPKPAPAPVAAAASSGWWRIALIAIVGALTYASSLSKPFIADDLGSIIRNPQIRDLSRLSQVFSPPANSPLSGRPLVNLSLAINYAVGGLDVTGYHLVNLALHLACGLLVFGIARQLFALPWAAAWVRGRAPDIALAAALVWTVHPLNSEVVDYVTQRTESMMAVCYLFTLYACLRAREAKHRTAWTAAAWGACAIGMACKETMATAPVAVLLVDATLVYGGWAEAWRARRRLYAGLAAGWIVLIALVAGGGQTWTAGFSSAQTTPWNYLLNQSVMIARYLRLALWPSDLVLNYGWTKPVTLAQVWPQFAFVSAIAIVVLVLLWTRPRLGCAGAFVLLTLGPTSSLVPIATEVGAERRMYLPMVVLAMLAVAAARWIDKRSTGAIAVATIVAVLAVVTIRRTSEYSSALEMARTMVERWPSANAHQMLGAELAGAGQHAEAIAHLRLAAGDYPPARYFLGTELVSQGQIDEGLSVLQAFVRDEPELPVVPDVRVTIAQALASKHQIPQAIEQLTLALSAKPDNLDAHALLADLLVDERRFDEAIAHYRTYAASRPNDPRGWTALGVALVAGNHRTDAVDAFRHAADLQPADSHAQTNLARALLEQGSVVEGAARAQQAVGANANDPAAHEVLGRALAMQGKIEDAKRELTRALQIDPTYAPAAEALRALLRAQAR